MKAAFLKNLKILDLKDSIHITFLTKLKLLQPLVILSLLNIVVHTFSIFPLRDWCLIQTSGGKIYSKQYSEILHIRCYTMTFFLHAYLWPNTLIPPSLQIITKTYNQNISTSTILWFTIATLGPNLIHQFIHNAAQR